MLSILTMRAEKLTLPRFDEFPRGSSHSLGPQAFIILVVDGQRQEKIENTSFSNLARKPNLAIVVFDEKLGIVESEPRAGA